jgi:hypothetical protein
LSDFAPVGATTVNFSGPSNTYHWRARTANAFGTASTWVDFNAAAIHFDFKRGSSGGGGGGGCSAAITPAGNDRTWIWGLAGLALLAALCSGRKPRRIEEV